MGGGEVTKTRPFRALAPLEEALALMLDRVVPIERTQMVPLREALDRVEQDIQLVLLDVELPDVNGLDLIAEIKERCPDCQIVLMTAHVKPGVGEEAVRRGAHGLVEKPLDLQGLVGMADEILHWQAAV